MDESATTWALVVGIDCYDSEAVPDLDGAAADAAEAVKWLRRLGVPDDQILLHAAPRSKNERRIDALGIPVSDARLPSIWHSVTKLRDVDDGTRLFVFLCGHGLYEPSSKRLFLTQEAGVNDAFTNLGVDFYTDLFLSLAFERQFLVMDGCLNLPYSTVRRKQIDAVLYPGVDPSQFMPREGASMVQCFGAAIGQRVAEIDGRGAFMRRLLPVMDPDHPPKDALTLDWASGRLQLDMAKAMGMVAPDVEADAKALTPSVKQTPQHLSLGSNQPGSGSPVFTTEGAPPVRLDVTVEPLAAVGDVEAIHVWVDSRPYWAIYRPEAGETTISVPFSCRVPTELSIRADCRVQPGTSWRAESELRFQPTSDQSVTFMLAPPDPSLDEGDPRDVLGVRLTELGGGDGSAAYSYSLPTGASRSDIGVESITMVQGPSEGYPAATDPQDKAAAEEVPDDVSRSRIKLYRPNGFRWGGLSDHYGEIESMLGLDLDWNPTVLTGEGSPWLSVGRGAQMRRHEDGPEFRFGPEAGVTSRRRVASWAKRIREVVPRDITVQTIVDDAAPPGPNIHIEFSSSPVELAGVLSTKPMVRVGRPVTLDEPVWRSKNGRSLEEIYEAPNATVEPGPTEVRIDLPWGTWKRVVKAPIVGRPVRLTLPPAIGSPPLRVAVNDWPSDRGWRIYGVDGTAPSGVVSVSDESTRVDLVHVDSDASAWSLGLPAGTAAPRHGIVELQGATTARFPMLHGWPLAVAWSDKGLWVEPLSKLPVPEWDLLVATGQLDALHPEDGVRLTQKKQADPLLGLAGAYATYAAADWGYLRTVVRNLGRLQHTGIDVGLLSIAATRRGAQGLDRESKDQLTRMSNRQQVPVMRWGIALALDLLSAAGLDESPWAVLLGGISADLSPQSTWTAWSPADARL